MNKSLFYILLGFSSCLAHSIAIPLPKESPVETELFKVSTEESRPVSRFESAIAFKEPIVGGYIYNFSLYISKKSDNSGYESGVFYNVNESKDLFFVKSLNKGENLLSNKDYLYLTQVDWVNESDLDLDRNYLVKKEYYIKNPTKLIITPKVETKYSSKGKSCLDFDYNFTMITATKKFSDHDNNLTLFSTSSKSNLYRCLNIDKDKYIKIRDINKNDFLDSINDKLGNFSLSDKNNYSLIIKITKEE